jgi:hypothetical protein
MKTKLPEALPSAPESTGVEHDMTRDDYAFRPKHGGTFGHVACWNGRKPKPGDWLILRNGHRTSRYRVIDVDLCWNVDPPTMWMADLVFDPRARVEADG